MPLSVVPVPAAVVVTVTVTVLSTADAVLPASTITLAPRAAMNRSSRFIVGVLQKLIQIRGTLSRFACRNDLDRQVKCDTESESTLID